VIFLFLPNTDGYWPPSTSWRLR